jgi:hypothetical protein
MSQTEVECVGQPQVAQAKPAAQQFEMPLGSFNPALAARPAGPLSTAPPPLTRRPAGA